MGTELLLIPGVAAVIRDEHGRILIQRSRHGETGDWVSSSTPVEVSLP